MKYHKDFNFPGYFNGEKLQRIVYLREGEIFGKIGTKKLKMPFNGFLMSAHTTKEAKVVGYHFVLKEKL